MKNEDFIGVKELVEQLKTKKIDMLVKTISHMDGQVYICYIGQLVDRNSISELIIKPILDFSTEKKRRLDAETVNSLIYADQSLIHNNLLDVEQNVIDGNVVLLFSNDKNFISVDCKKVESRPVSPPELQYSQRSPRDSFVENIDTNLSLLRYRIKDANLRIEKKEVGIRTKSTVALVYIADIINENVIKEIVKRIDNIQIDGIFESGELQNFLLNKKSNLFPQMGIVERSDYAVELLLEGKVVILVDGSCLALSAPKVFAEFFYACDDRYENKFFGLFMRLIRYIAFFISLTATSYYIALAEFHPDAMPASYIVTFAQMRARAPFSAFIAVLSIEFIIELMREALIRVPVKIGSAIAIVGAIIIGQAASSSGIYSPLLLILVSIGFLSSFAVPDITLTNPMRIFKFFLMILTGFFGFYGFSLGITGILTLIVSNDSYGIPYVVPWAPYNSYDFLRSLIFSRSISSKRQQYMRNKDATRAPHNRNK